MSEEKKTARQIIEGYDGPAVRIMEVCGTMKSSAWVSANFFQSR